MTLWRRLSRFALGYSWRTANAPPLRLLWRLPITLALWAALFVVAAACHLRRDNGDYRA